MSEENVEIARRYLEEMPQEAPEDPELLSAWVARFWDSDGSYYPVRKFPEARPCHGPEEIASFLAEYLKDWKTYRYTIEDARAIGDDRVLAQGHASAQGRVSGMELEGDLYHCLWVRHRRLIRVEDHLTLKGALHALGLKGESLETDGLPE